MTPRPHWLFGDQLGPHFLSPPHGGPDAQAPVVMIEARSVLSRRRFHRAKAHLVLSAMRHRAAELGDRVTYVRSRTYAEGLEGQPQVTGNVNRLEQRLVFLLALLFGVGERGDRPLPAVEIELGGATLRQVEEFV